MRNTLRFALPLLFLFVGRSAFAQVKVYLMGSSTIAGSGSTMDSSWTARLERQFRQNMADGQDTVFTNVGYPGYVTYKGMPTGYVPPSNPDRSGFQPDAFRNVTRAINEGFHLVLISYASNDVNLWPNYTQKETMDNLRAMYQQLTGAGIRTFILSMQPRNDFGADQKQWLRELTDSVTNNFGYYSINVYNDLVTNDGTNSLRPEVNADNIHPNNTGHRLIFQRVAAKQLFGPAAAPLPVRISEFRGAHQGNGIRLSWRSAGEEPGTSYEVQRAPDGRNFTALATLSGNGQAAYGHTDAGAGPGNNYYRLLVREPGRTFHSPVVMLNGARKELFLQRLSAGSSSLKLEVGAARSGPATLRLVSINGAEVLRKEVQLHSAGTSLDIPVAHLPAGDYVVHLQTDAAVTSQRFAKAH